MKTASTVKVAAIVVLGIFLLSGTGYLVVKEFLSEPQPPMVLAAATGPATMPLHDVQTDAWNIPALASPDPAQYAPAADAAISKLIEQHNAGQDRLVEVAISGKCAWSRDRDGRPLTIAFHRAGGRAEMTCGPDSCQVEGGHITTSPGSAMEIDALYLLMFRKYNPKEFRAVVADTTAALTADKPAILAQSPTEKLAFDAETGRLIGAQVTTEAGVVTVRFDDFQLVDGAGQTLMPMRVSTMVPPDLYPPPQATEGRATLQIEKVTMGAAQ